MNDLKITMESTLCGYSVVMNEKLRLPECNKEGRCGLFRLKCQAQS
ncbi:hypothetical protein ROSINTL182_08706 [Roseburia intestinalis L1-82]|jgi:hypothetical protein|uniref:Uncharacterized protein n=1 Tax=Roseburia intestinalis L1-82 TaxID=536231 RepID=C7GFJ9_9FIRM|nr:hypothetical protein ROSINTL182_08706 [Roseburia intestinalis L1-82]